MEQGAVVRHTITVDGYQVPKQVRAFCISAPMGMIKAKDDDGDSAAECIDIASVTAVRIYDTAAMEAFCAVPMTDYLLYYTIFVYLCQGILPKRQNQICKFQKRS